MNINTENFEFEEVLPVTELICENTGAEQFQPAYVVMWQGKTIEDEYSIFQGYSESEFATLPEAEAFMEGIRAEATDSRVIGLKLVFLVDTPIDTTGMASGWRIRLAVKLMQLTRWLIN